MLDSDQTNSRLPQPVSNIEFEELKQQVSELKDRHAKLEESFRDFMQTILKSYGVTSDKSSVQAQSSK